MYMTVLQNFPWEENMHTSYTLKSCYSSKVMTKEEHLWDDGCVDVLDYSVSFPLSVCVASPILVVHLKYENDF